MMGGDLNSWVRHRDCSSGLCHATKILLAEFNTYMAFICSVQGYGWFQAPPARNMNHSEQGKHIQWLQPARALK